MELTRRFAAVRGLSDALISLMSGSQGYERFGKDERIIALRDRVLKYNKLLRAHGLRDHQVQKTALKAGHSITLIVWRLVLLSFYAIIALPGFVLRWEAECAADALTHTQAPDQPSGCFDCPPYWREEEERYDRLG